MLVMAAQTQILSPTAYHQNSIYRLRSVKSIR